MPDGVTGRIGREATPRNLSEKKETQQKSRARRPNRNGPWSSDSPDYENRLPPLKVRPWSANHSKKSKQCDAKDLQFARSKSSLNPSGLHSHSEKKVESRSWAVTELPGSSSEEEIKEEVEKVPHPVKGAYAEKKNRISQALEAWIKGDPHDSDEYDTDLEEDEQKQELEEHETERQVEVDDSGAYYYLELCQKKGVIPVSYLIRHMGDKHMKMRHRYLSHKGIKIFAEALQRNTAIEALDLSDNYLDDSGAKTLANILREHMFIHSVDFSMNFIKHLGVLSIANMLEHNTTLKTISLSGNNLTDKDARVLSEALKNNISLTFLNLSHNNFGELGGMYLAAGLGANEGLTDIDLSWNSIRQRGAAALAMSLKVNTSLEILDVSWNGMSLEGCAVLAKVLKVNKTLKVLDLSNNRLGTQAVQKLSIGLKYNKGLETLLMNMNPAGEAGMEALIKALSVNETLRLLAIEDITLTPSIYMKMKELEEKKQLLIVHGGFGGYCKASTPVTVIKLFNQFLSDNRQNLEVIFKQLDKNKSGDLTLAELKHGLKQNGLRLTNRMIDMLLEELDTDKSGSLDYSELLHGQTALHKKREFAERQKEILNPDRERLATLMKDKHTLLS